eukprot:CAMPEP_0181170268 /NCGR_PEP_ID=MMETSP1096-20121128/1270_1 /TAXON_ID=156174 ORGANISM="Chrysochromulina ericina, Strain CCMP281" /NCGR_SAMPLE_ID=MMETSP1096 /ASSEMBLY_ACC=CAM_ASM_000453 /LENGTH=105 /DNA_ID=CAMNT_0023257807 /DNA_START=318 /DNA_END=632 /DNA_ORIENTATION=-
MYRRRAGPTAQAVALATPQSSKTPSAMGPTEEVSDDPRDGRCAVSCTQEIKMAAYDGVHRRLRIKAFRHLHADAVVGEDTRQHPRARPQRSWCRLAPERKQREQL